MKINKPVNPYEGLSLLEIEQIRVDDMGEFVDIMHEAGTHEWPYVCVVLQNMQMMLEFLKKSGLLSLGDKYIDGIKGIPIMVGNRRPRFIPRIKEKKQPVPVDESKDETGYRSRKAAEDNRFEDAVNSAFWFCITFPTEEKRREMLPMIGIDPDDPKLPYCDGMELAASLGIELETPVPPFASHAKPWKELVEMAM
jgi:hypothetical protein